MPLTNSLDVLSAQLPLSPRISSHSYCSTSSATHADICFSYLFGCFKTKLVDGVLSPVLFLLQPLVPRSNDIPKNENFPKPGIPKQHSRDCHIECSTIVL